MGNQHGKERRNYGRKIDWEHAERPSPPGKPYLVPENPDSPSDFITIRWSPPVSDGGAPIIGYLVEHRRTGSPHWLRASPHLAEDTELTLTGLEPGWRYQFRVSAENDIGRSDPGELSEPLTVTLQRTAATAPHFNRELHDTIALENEKVEFTVHVIATPPPKISWYKDGFEIFSSRRTKIVTDNDQSTLIIHQAALEDEGEIKCTATNRAGHVVTKANLKLEAPPRIRLPRQYEEGLLFEKGETIRLKVSTAGRPLPKIYWYHNGEIIQNGGRYEITETERNSTLKINEAKRDDRGEYLIKGINKIGEDATAFLVTVTDRPHSPGKAQIVMTLGRSVTLSWTAPDDDGGCKIGNYIVEYFRIGWNMWLKAATCRQLTTTLSELIEGSEYKFRVKAENPYGISDPGEESDVIFIPDLKRGILQPPTRKESELTWLDEPQKRSSEDDNDKGTPQEAKRRKLLEENAKKLLDTPLPVLLPRENTTFKLIEKPTRTERSLSPSPSPKLDRHNQSISERKETTKRQYEDENVPPPVPKRRGKGEKHNLNINREEPISIHEPIEDKNNNSKKDSLEKTASESLRKKNFIPEISIEEPDYESNNYLRENDDSVLHGSSEFMLVLLPERSKSPELSAQQRSEIEMSLAESGIAPPMSLSAPELGSGEPLEMPLMRDAVSSTELLHERAMARMYQAAADEESQRLLKRRYSMDRKSVERRSSIKEGILERRHSLKETIIPDLTKATDNLRSKPEESVSKAKEKSPEQKMSKIPIMKTPKKFEEVKSTSNDELSIDEIKKSSIPRLKRESTTPEPKPKAILRKEERLNSIEREQLEFALVRDRIRQKNEQNLQPRELPARPPNLQQQSSMSSQLSSFEGEGGNEINEKEEEEIEGEDEEYIEEEEEEEDLDYLEDEEEEEEEEDEEDIEEEIEIEEYEEEEHEETKLNDSKYRPKVLGLQTPPPVPKHGVIKERIEDKKPIKMAPYAEEEDTYHPRSMIPTRSILPKFETPLPVTIESSEEIKTEKPKAELTIEMVKKPVSKSPIREIAPIPKPITPPLEKPKAENKIGITINEPKESTISKPEQESKDTSKIPVPAEKPAKKKTPILKKIEKLTLKKRDKKKPTVASLIIDSTAPMASVVVPKPILKKKPSLKKKEKETSKNKKSNKDSAADEDEQDTNKKKKQVRIAEPREDETNVKDQKLQRRQQSIEEDEQANKVLIYHYSDIVREFGGGKKPPPKLYLNYEELKAHVDDDDDFDKLLLPPPPIDEEEINLKTDEPEQNKENKSPSPQSIEETPVIENPHSEKLSEAEESVLSKTPSPEPEVSSQRSSSERTHSPSPITFRALSPEEKVRSSMEYVTDVALFLVACWLYLFKNELYAIPILCLMVYRQLKDSVQERYRNVKQSISNKIPERFKKKPQENSHEEENDKEK